jgi:hypothetical protein
MGRRVAMGRHDDPESESRLSLESMEGRLATVG